MCRLRGVSPSRYSCCQGVPTFMQHERWRSNTSVVLSVLVIALAGPGLGLALWALGIAFAPPWTFLTGMIYPLLGFLGLPLGIVAAWTRRFPLWGVLTAFAVTIITALLLLTTVGPRVPTGMTSCRPLAVPPPQARYTCVSTSSDDTSYRFEFVLEGRANWPVMRLASQKP